MIEPEQSETVDIAALSGCVRVPPHIADLSWGEITELAWVSEWLSKTAAMGRPRAWISDW